MDIYDCKTDIQLESGEELVLTSRLKNDRGSVYMDSFDHVVRFKSSNDEHVRELETASCRHSVNCDRADRLQVLPTNCD